MTRRLLPAALTAVAALATTTPADAVGGLATYVTYTSSGAFACHAVARTGPRTAPLGTATRIFCSVNGVRETVRQGFGWHAHAAGDSGEIAVGSVVEICVDASTVYGLFPPLYVQHTNCESVVVAPAGTMQI